MNDLDINVELRENKRGAMCVQTRIRHTGSQDLMNNKEFFVDHFKCDFDRIWESIGESIKEYYLNE